MIPHQPDISLAANLRRLGTLVQDWPGEPIDTAGTVRAIRPDDPLTPVYWCFNATAEFTALAEAFGPGQPLVGMRSLSLIMTLSDGTSRALDLLAAHYADALLRRFGPRPCIVGGNCQSAAIAWRVAIRLMAAGVAVERLVFLDAEPHLPFPGPVRVLFGAESAGFNPYLKPPEDVTRPVPWHWERAWSRVDCRIVPGAHGQYFRPENLPDVARAILAPGPDGETTMALPGEAPVIRFRTALTTTAAIWIEAEIPPALAAMPGLSVLPLWRGADGGLLRVPGPDWVVPVTTRPFWRCRFPRPGPFPGATVLPLPCLAGQGPLVWPSLLRPSVSSELTESGLTPSLP
ncbi:hypothetical protein E7811_11415 [Aliigemmobacter aestuarii]|uniref:Thioesterase domain-containing protein n=1 Tax=Aliigemmobacter aestuarii TaxID=1445661 RepID=A0A4S3MKU3_9RHOB|nr:hypothetical protein [Gemmobacter aestuarii]THD82766.1 hypothetical protein E7811_11415 [Gemmobacter aestuarii]